ncbi:metal ABC transporter ATPase, partial [Pseudomonas brassicacearum]|nr:metal ABC transporter ATPase [Pseudomonas brassicacearum]
LYLMPLKDGRPLAELYTLKKDELVPASTRGLYLAESFARQEGWVVQDERVRWKDWVKRQGLVEPKREPASHLERFGEKARELLARARTTLHK